MKELLRQLFWIILAISSAPVKADGTGVSSPIVVDQITVYNGNLFLWSNQFLNPDSCASATVAIVPANTPQWQAFYSTALTSLSTGKAATFWFSGCSTEAPWASTVPIVVLMSIHK